MSTLKGTGLIITVDGNPIGFTKSFTLDLNVAIADASTRDSAGDTEGIPGRRSGGMSFEGVIDTTTLADGNTVGFSDLVTEGYVNRATFTLVWGTGEVGTQILTVDAHLTSLSSSAPDEEAVTFSGNFQFTGAVVPTTVA